MGDEQRVPADELITRAREQFEAADDFTIAVEEEFAIVDPETLGLVNRFEEVQAAAQGTALEEHLVGELIASEVEIRTGKQPSFAEVPATMAERRSQLQQLVEPMGLILGATGTHPWADWKEQRIIDTPHYRRNDELLRYVVWRNNTFGLHVHVAVNGPDRVIAVEWGKPAGDHALYPIDVLVEAVDRPSLLRDITEVFAKEKINVTGAHTQSVRGSAGSTAWMTFTVEVASSERLAQVLKQVIQVSGVRSARRR